MRGYLRLLFRSASLVLIRDHLLISKKCVRLHEMIAESICCCLYSRLPTMKARSFIVRALLSALVLVPFAMRTSAKPLGALSCHVTKPQFRTVRAGGHRALDQLVASMPGHHAPAPRLHRIRGKKISIQRGLVQMPRSFTPTHFLVLDARVGQHDMDGPNPSRGPPSQFSL